MTSAYKLGILLLFSVLLVSIYAGDDKEEVRKKIQEANKEMARDMEKGNLQGNLDMYTDDAISMPMFEKMNRGKAQIEAAMKKDAGNTKFSDVTFETTDVIGSGDMYIEIGKYNMNVTMTKMDKDMDMNHMEKMDKDMDKMDKNMSHMGKPFNAVGKYMTVWKVMPDGSLKIQADIWNSDSDASMQMVGEPKANEMTGDKK